MLTQKSKTKMWFIDASGDETEIEALNNIGEVTIETVHGTECVLTVLDKAQAIAVGLALIGWAQTGVLSADPPPIDQGTKALIARLNDPEKYADAVDDAARVLKAQAQEIAVLRAQMSGKQTHEISVRCAKCLADVIVMVSCEYSEIANAVSTELKRGVFGFSEIDGKPYCEKCAKDIANA